MRLASPPAVNFSDMEASRKIGRPTILKKGPLTPAERQQRHRAKKRRQNVALGKQAIIAANKKGSPS